MDRTVAFEKMQGIIVETMGLDSQQVSEQASFTDDMGLDSLDLLELMTSLEDEFGVTIPDEDFDVIHCLSDVLDELEKLGC